MNKFELAERIAELLDGSWASEKIESTTHIRADFDESDGSIDISVGKRKFTLKLIDII